MEKSKRRFLQGEVTSDKMDKTVVVSIFSRKMHPLYKKYIGTTKKIMAQDNDNTARMGDVVRVGETRPLSKKKRWEILSIVKRAQ